MNLDELIERLQMLQSKGYGNLLVVDCDTFMEIESVKKGIAVDCKTSEEIDVIIIIT